MAEIQRINGYSLDDAVEEAKLIQEGDSDAVYAHYCLQKLHKFPHEFLNLDFKEKAFVIASINKRIDDEKKEAAKMKNNYILFFLKGGEYGYYKKFNSGTRYGFLCIRKDTFKFN